MNRSLWQRSIALIALVALGLAACTAYVPEADPYRVVNRQLRGERAIVELRGGEVAVGVHHVRFGEAETSWVDDDGPHRAPTEDVARVIVVTRNVPHWGWWVLAGLGLALILDDHVPFEIALDLALDAFVWGAEVPPAVGRVIYPAPLAGH
jgi:hypothetical protein